MSYVNIEVPDELKKKVTKFLSSIVKLDKKNIRKGINETTKYVERQKAKLVVIAGDVDPPQVVFHLPLICDEKNVPYVFVDTKDDLGKAADLSVGCSAIAVVNIPKEEESALKDIASKVKSLKK
ncbi:MAG: 50S ribosomal protein L7ae [Candidatus Lokiarchaeota archaeon]|nr:50S ribosomal protein L7ae [Candidatus Lokiarchaeota archaeon]